jgi:hypothetical protein
MSLAGVAHIGRNGDVEQQGKERDKRAGLALFAQALRRGGEAMAGHVEMQSREVLAGPEDRV